MNFNITNKSPTSQEITIQIHFHDSFKISTHTVRHIIFLLLTPVYLKALDILEIKALSDISFVIGETKALIVKDSISATFIPPQISQGKINDKK